MPLKYTFNQIQDAFMQKDCIIINQNYENQLSKLDYTASCGHNNQISFKLFLKGGGVKCKNCALDIPTYQSISSEFESKNCKLCYTKDEFEIYYKNNKQKLKYIASCGHSNEVCWKNFNSLNQGINCPSCVNKNTGIKLKELRNGENKKIPVKEAILIYAKWRFSRCCW
jgi:hypothetical protein